MTQNDHSIADEETRAGLMIDRLTEAASFAYAPISGFMVGAAALGGSGQLYLGANLEIAGQPLSFALHAEQAAILNAWRHGERQIAALAVSASPCGHCRQFLQELAEAETLEIRLADRSCCRLGDLLPKPFGPAALGLTADLLTPQNHQLVLADANDPAIAAAIAAANQSYVPYSGSPSGVAVQLTDGAIYSGATAESAAYNPTVPAITHALSALLLSGADFPQISRVILAERAAKISQRELTDAILVGVSTVTLTYISL